MLVPRAVHRRGSADDGFTTVELMVVLLVMGILLAVAVPTFLGTTAAADDRSAQSNLVTALTEAQSQFQDSGQTYLDAPTLVGDLAQVQPSLSFLAATPTQGSSGSLSDISVSVSNDGEGLVLAAYSVPGNCFYVVTNATDLSHPSRTATPYAGSEEVTTTATPAPAVPAALALPATAGTAFVRVSGDTMTSDCNASTPKTNGPPETVQYSVEAFPH